VTESVILSNAKIGNGAVIRKAILDKNVVVSENAKIGVNAEEDLARGFTISESGITVVGKGVTVQPLTATSSPSPTGSKAAVS
jgi:glucose-1-phosphate adenylyltransferase